jgi:hypothetical protein
MLSTALRLVGVDLERQWLRLKAQAEDFKDRTTDEIKGKAIDAGLAVGFALAGLWFVILTVIAGLVALYLWVEVSRGPIVALGAVAGTTAVLAVVLFIAAAMRGGTKRKRPVKPVAEPTPAAAIRSPAGAPFYEAVTRNLTDQTVAATNEALDAAAGIVRRSPREVILATLAVAIVAGVFIGRKR